jgi:hypothetical protein
MRNKLKLFVLLSVLLSLMAATNVMAQTYGWYTCTVKQVGTIDASTRYVWLTDTGGAFTNTAFRFNFTNIANEQLATLLTAISSNKSVYAYVGSGLLGYVYLKE